MTWLWILLALSGGACFGYVLCALLSAASREDEREDARAYYEARVGEMCARCRAMDEERADAEEFNRL